MMFSIYFYCDFQISINSSNDVYALFFPQFTLFSCVLTDQLVAKSTISSPWKISKTDWVRACKSQKVMPAELVCTCMQCTCLPSRCIHERKSNANLEVVGPRKTKMSNPIPELFHIYHHHFAIIN